MDRAGQDAQAERIAALNAKYLWHPMVAPQDSAANPPLVIASGSGVHVTDIDGKTYLDGTAGLWCVNVGHNHPRMKRAMAEQLDRIAYYPTFGHSSNPPVIELSAKLMEMLKPEGMARVLFSSGGSDANETAFKLARQYWKLEGQPEKTKIVSLANGYHGLHFGGMSASGHPVWHRAYEPTVPGFVQVETPYRYRSAFPAGNDFAGLYASLLEREILKQSADTVAAFIAEPVQGAGGVIVPPAEYWPLVREICDRHNVLLIADEVVTGFGRTGKLFGCRLWGVAPDIMSFAKGINSAYVPLGATVVSERVAAAWYKGRQPAPIMHGYTYTGHPLACAAALENLAIIEEEGLVANAATVGAYLGERLGRLERFPSVGEVRGVGLMHCIEMVQDRATKQPYPPGNPFSAAVTKHCKDQGVLIRLLGHQLILSPALIFSRGDVDVLVGAIESALETFDRR